MEVLPSTEALTDQELLEYARQINPTALKRLHQIEQLRWKKFQVLDTGFITLVDVMGDDNAIVQAARVSYGAGTKQVSDDAALIGYLMRHRHTTPYEMAQVKIHVKCPMDTWRQWIRHRTQSVNEYSTRYSIAIDDAQETTSAQWRLQSKSNKQGSSGNLTDWPDGFAVLASDVNGEILANQDDIAEDHLNWSLVKKVDSSTPDMVIHFWSGIPKNRITPGMFLSNSEYELLEHSRGVYEIRLALGVAREQARKDLPLSTYTSAYICNDLHNWLHFLSLRMDKHAQLEIRQFATTLGHEIIKPLFPACWNAFEKYRLNATMVSESAKAVIDKLKQFSSNMYLCKNGEYTRSAYGLAIKCLYPEWITRLAAGKPVGEYNEIAQTLISIGLLQKDS